MLSTTRKKLHDRPGLLLFLEAVIVFLSVFLALGLDSWRTNTAAQRLAERALENFEREVRLNREEILKAYDHHEVLSEDLRENRRGVTLKPATIQNNAWEIAQYTGAVNNLDFEILDRASRIHELQRQYQHTVESATGIIYQGNFMDFGEMEEERLQYALLYLVSWLIQEEKALLEHYDDFLQVMDS